MASSQILMTVESGQYALTRVFWWISTDLLANKRALSEIAHSAVPSEYFVVLSHTSTGHPTLWSLSCDPPWVNGQSRLIAEIADLILRHECARSQAYTLKGHDSTSSRQPPYFLTTSFFHERRLYPVTIELRQVSVDLRVLECMRVMLNPPPTSQHPSAEYSPCPKTINSL